MLLWNSRLCMCLRPRHIAVLPLLVYVLPYERRCAPSFLSDWCLLHQLHFYITYKKLVFPYVNAQHIHSYIIKYIYHHFINLQRGEQKKPRISFGILYTDVGRNVGKWMGKNCSDDRNYCLPWIMILHSFKNVPEDIFLHGKYMVATRKGHQRRGEHWKNNECQINYFVREQEERKNRIRIGVRVRNECLI